MGKKLATGGFGTVYKATLEEDGRAKPVIVKKATEFGEAEVGRGVFQQKLKSAPQSAACLEIEVPSQMLQPRCCTRLYCQACHLASALCVVPHVLNHNFMNPPLNLVVCFAGMDE